MMLAYTHISVAVGVGLEPTSGDSVIDKVSFSLLVNRLSITYFLTQGLETKGCVCQFHHPTVSAFPPGADPGTLELTALCSAVELRKQVALVGIQPTS